MIGLSVQGNETHSAHLANKPIIRSLLLPKTHSFRTRQDYCRLGELN